VLNNCDNMDEGQKDARNGKAYSVSKAYHIDMIINGEEDTINFIVGNP